MRSRSVLYSIGASRRRPRLCPRWWWAQWRRRREKRRARLRRLDGQHRVTPAARRTPPPRPSSPKPMTSLTTTSRPSSKFKVCIIYHSRIAEELDSDSRTWSPTPERRVAHRQSGPAHPDESCGGSTALRGAVARRRGLEVRARLASWSGSLRCGRSTRQRATPDQSEPPSLTNVLQLSHAIYMMHATTQPSARSFGTTSSVSCPRKRSWSSPGPWNTRWFSPASRYGRICSIASSGSDATIHRLAT